MSILGVYDNWESLVKAVIDREHLHRLALCNSFSSASTYCVPSTPSIASSDSLHAHVGNGASTGGVVCTGPLTLPVPAIAPVNGWKKKLKDHLFGVPGEQDPEVHQLSSLEKFSLHELRIATDEFSNQLILGRGGLSKVYKGQLADGSLVAVKRLHNTHHENLLSQTELRMINMVVHPNLLRLRGFCITPEERLLVYPFMANGSAASCLRERPESQPPLDWSTRGRIALGSARGLDHLHEHCDKKIIHRDVKAANVFLNENFDAVVGDFNLAKLMDHKDSYVTTAIHGTVGHIAPEYISSFRLSEKTDVFAYGIMLLELITGQGASTLARLANEDNVKIFDWVKCLLKTKKMETLADPNLGGNYVDEEMEKMLRVAINIMCIHDSPNKRPKMSDVVRLLEGDDLGCLANRWEKWQKLNQEIFSE